MRRAHLFGRCEAHSGKAPFDRLMAQVRDEQPYRWATRVFWAMDNGSAPRGATAQAGLQQRCPQVVPVHTPVPARWLGQAEEAAFPRTA